MASRPDDSINYPNPNTSQSMTPEQTLSAQGLKVYEIVTRRPTKKVNEDRQCSEFHIAPDMQTAIKVIEHEFADTRTTVVAIIERHPILTITGRHS